MSILLHFFNTMRNKTSKLSKPLTRFSTRGAFRRRFGLWPLFLLVVFLVLRLWALSTHQSLTRHDMESWDIGKGGILVDYWFWTTNRSRAGSFPVVFLGFLWVLLCLGVVMLAFMLLKKNTCHVKQHHHLSPRLMKPIPTVTTDSPLRRAWSLWISFSSLPPESHLQMQILLRISLVPEIVKCQSPQNTHTQNEMAGRVV